MIEREGSEFAEFDGFSIEFRAISHRYWLHQNSERTTAVSVTSALNVLNKPALVGWAERVGIEDAVSLMRQGVISEGVSTRDAPAVVKSYGMGAEAKRDAGADRGTAVHEALRLYCAEGRVPALGEFPEAVRGYVQGVCGWLVETEPEPILTEQIVGSPTYSFAGRFDLLATIAGRSTLVDLKTSAKVWPEHHVQMAGYEVAMVECDIEAPDETLILAAAEDGTYTTAECKAGPADFLTVLAAHRTMIDLKAKLRAEEKDILARLDRTA